MEYEIVEPIDCGSWQDDCDRLTRLRPWRAIATDDMRVKVIDVPESDES